MAIKGSWLPTLFKIYYIFKFVYLSYTNCDPLKNPNRFETTWGWGNDDRIFIYEWTIPWV